jgi:LytS/YehU family sensor histidine kinase
MSNNIKDTILNNYLLKIQSSNITIDEKFKIVDYLTNVNYTKYSNCENILSNIDKAILQLDDIHSRYENSKNKLREIKKMVQNTKVEPVIEKEYVDNNIKYLFRSNLKNTKNKL